MSPTEIKAALSILGGGANKGLGQHFLIDATALEVIVSSAAIREGDRVLEIGPGLGVLTRALLEKGAEVVAIEQDRRMIEYLSRGQNNRLQVSHGDAAAIHWHTLIGEGNWKFVANLPYSITSLALRKALWAPHPPEVAVVLVQREVAERAVSVAPNPLLQLPLSKGERKKHKTSLLSLMVALACSSARIVRRVPPGAFYPPPKVDSAVLQLIPMPWGERQAVWGIEPEKIMRLAKLGFAHPRKLLASNLGGKQAVEALKTVGLSEKIRAEDVSPLEWARLTQSMTP
ncbi:ribosomal RNA small subunit methyltransferase A [Patescibacteria group bacterium]|nr:ribosomal RNA small subunit methyltransferase A [Patescibacteria group bacterium]MBP9710185.1 ribosomal RNA small subunit methyltransferase A [Patescibacteria group bacterium]